MNKKGFTLVELLVVIIILGALIVFIAPTFLRADDSSKNKVLQSKIEGIEQAAVLWAQSYSFDLVWTNTQCSIIDRDLVPSSRNINCEKSVVNIQRLIDDKFLTPEKEGKVFDPVTNTPLEGDIALSKYYGSYYAVYQK
ncbi:MAG: prepilin-type N-terminal cleavage/methylation domain-containing protein [Mollicutes bacterium]|nr:prepilin-type N-terminal cleavage/methylation domain-containing protein [Mollicutes bacterium]